MLDTPPQDKRYKHLHVFKASEQYCIMGNGHGNVGGKC